MITSIARQSVILKCLRKKSVLVGNYEFYYLAGLCKKLYHLNINGDMEPSAISETILQALDHIEAANEEEAFLLKMVSVYEPGKQMDAQMKELFAWGEAEEDLWQVETTHSGEEYVTEEGGSGR